MHADLSRLTHRPERHYSAVVAQQGRVQLDADANEQTAIQLFQARTLAADLIGPHGGPRGATGFRIALRGGSRELDDLVIGGGRYYVDGILCDATRPQPGVPVPAHGTADTGKEGKEGKDGGGDGEPAAPPPPATWTYWDQPDGFRDPERPGDRLPTAFPYLVYLKVWERLVTAAEDPALREVALGSALPDTAARAKVVWQVLPLPAAALGLDTGNPTVDEVRAAFARWAEQAATPGSRLAARGEHPGPADDEPCLVAPDARYRGPENQLYRVEVHDGGSAKDATFKWSRENGSVTFPVDGLDGTWVELATLGSDDTLDLDVGDLVEFVDTGYTSRGEAEPLLRVEEVDLPGRRVRLSDEPAPGVGRRPELHPFLRRWDHHESSRRTSGRGARDGRLRHGALPVEEGGWLPLEDGVEVWFAPGGSYRTGDFWLIPARTATGGVEWPTDPARRPLLQYPSGIAVHFAPLAWIAGEQTEPDLRLAFRPLAASIPAADDAALAAEEEARAAESDDPSYGSPYDASGPAPSRSQTTAAAEAAVDEEGTA
ncbi:DUF6519 domain-containing protein [Streptomyces sp. Je 1-4]|uniref:DUF6519 domain-containing protein n=1 Tax=Streptomyces TaxID=1883 RepID=UPI0021D92407|nr:MULTISPECIES: DUF6519 domain-containing protein [unclassified Streptomyces]UYB40435.1 DUF6519 domain-containing protein [Streptomyces sp. Je 1-4]UZQ36551.1 DUF6519 domain-containing protein [Streptomyces sp. Je 1-4] [Streptomyces sp. Je 1-4 4N24]UZQ43968.1 DUF6519 domain-containing protein [Streptomyces sp. Je 1-4] [Streptomyces sp. Je 1-4 4N24_ara]